MGVASTRTWWTVLVLTVTGLLVGATVRWAPGHAGIDPATTELVSEPLPCAPCPVSRSPSSSASPAG